MLNRGTGRVFPQDTSVRSPGIIPPMLHIHFSAAVIGRTSVPSFKSSNKAIYFLQIRRAKKKGSPILGKIYMFRRRYEGESVIIRNAAAFVFLLAALSFSRASLGVVFFLSQLCGFEIARSVPLSQP